MNDLQEIMGSIDYVLKYGGSSSYIVNLKNKINNLDTDTKLFILSEIPLSIQFMCENQSEEFLLEVVEFFPQLFKYFANNTTEKVCISAIKKNVINFNYIINPSLLLYDLYLSLCNNE